MAEYRLEYNSAANADLRSLFQDQNLGPAQQQAQSAAPSYSLAASLQGDMTLVTLNVSPTRAQVLQTYRNPQVRLVVNGQPQPEQAAAVELELSRGFLVELTRQGKVAGVYLRPEAAKFAQDFIRTLVASEEFVFPAAPPPDGQSWNAREEDRNGVYIARYRIVSASIAGHPDWIALRKSKVRYLPEPADATPPVPGRDRTEKSVRPQMDFEAEFDLESGDLATLRGTEIQDTSIKDKPIAHSETILQLRRVRTAVAPAEEMGRLRELRSVLTASTPLALYAQRPRAEVEANVQRSELGSATVKELLDALAAFKATSSDPEKQQASETPLYLKVKALVYVHPESCAQLETILETADATSPQFRIVSGALGAVAHPQAQRVLARAIQARPADSAALAGMISALGSAPQPGREAERAVQQLAETSSDNTVASTAILALGNMARSLSRSSPERAAALVTFLMRRLSAARSEEVAQRWIQALGNSASSQAFPALSKYASNSSPVLRSAAIDSLRSIRLPQVDAMLLHALASDQEAQVRQEAAFALGFRRPSQQSFDAQKKALQHESDEKVRSALLTNLFKMNRQFPEAKSILEDAAVHDVSESVRKTARSLLDLSPQ